MLNSLSVLYLGFILLGFTLLEMDFAWDILCLKCTLPGINYAWDVFYWGCALLGVILLRVNFA